MVGFRNWCITLPDEELYTRGWFAVSQALPGNHCVFLVGQKEVGAAGYVHWQLYAEFSRQVSRVHVKRMIGERAHCEARMGTQQQAYDYCTKLDTQVPGTTFEFGARKAQGARSDLDAVVDALERNTVPADIAAEFGATYIKYHAGIDAKFFKRQSKQRRTWKTRVHVLWGVPGAGKTWRAWQELQLLAGDVDDDIWAGEIGGGRFAEGYIGQKYCLLDDIDNPEAHNGMSVPFNVLMKMMDAYPYRVEVKGASAQWVCRDLYLTANTSPDDWYAGIAAVKRTAMLRRLDNVRHYEVVYVPHPFLGPPLFGGAAAGAGELDNDGMGGDGIDSDVEEIASLDNEL